MALRFVLGKQKPCFSILSLIRQNGSHARNMSVDAERELPESSEMDAEPDNRQRRFWSQCINEVKLLGRVGAEPQLKQSVERKPFVFMPVVTESFFKNSSGEITKSVMWHKILVKDPFMQEFCLNQVTKGSKVYISGALNNQKVLMEDNASEPVLITHVRADKLLLLRKNFPRLNTEKLDED